MERLTRVDIIIGIWTTLWTLYCWPTIGPFTIFPRTESNSYYLARSGLGPLGTRTLHYAREDVRVCAYYQATIYPTDGSRRQRHKQDHLRAANDQPGKEVQANTRGDLQQTESTGRQWNLAKVLFYDIVGKTRRPAGISVVDADNCYD